MKRQRSAKRKSFAFKALSKLAQDYQKNLSVETQKGKGLSGTVKTSDRTRQGWLRQVVPKATPWSEAAPPSGQKRSAPGQTGAQKASRYCVVTGHRYKSLCSPTKETPESKGQRHE